LEKNGILPLNSIFLRKRKASIMLTLFWVALATLYADVPAHIPDPIIIEGSHAKALYDGMQTGVVKSEVTLFGKTYLQASGVVRCSQPPEQKASETKTEPPEISCSVSFTPLPHRRPHPPASPAAQPH
jgi:hypothetical protein